MLALIHLTEAVVEEEVSALPRSIAFGVGVFLLFGLLLFAVTRLNPDR